jgi:hypothetical protein
VAFSEVVRLIGAAREKAIVNLCLVFFLPSHSLIVSTISSFLLAQSSTFPSNRLERHPSTR